MVTRGYIAQASRGLKRFSLFAFDITVTELKLIASAASRGLKRIPKKG